LAGEHAVTVPQGTDFVLQEVPSGAWLEWVGCGRNGCLERYRALLGRRLLSR
jgi:hypothetical protein